MAGCLTLDGLGLLGRQPSPAVTVGTGQRALSQAPGAGRRPWHSCVTQALTPFPGICELSPAFQAWQSQAQE